VPLQGYTNGWPIDPPGCASLEFHYAPDRLVTSALVLSALACALLALFLVVRRRRREREAPDAGELELVRAGRRVALPAALAIGVLAAAVVGFVFALRAGAVAGPLVALALWRGVSARALILASGAALAVVVPVLYAAFPAQDRGGYDTGYANAHLGAHWVSVGAFVGLAVALALELVVRRAARRGLRFHRSQR
jgi:hypothetical protein